MFLLIYIFFIDIIFFSFVEFFIGSTIQLEYWSLEPMDLANLSMVYNREAMHRLLQLYFQLAYARYHSNVLMFPIEVLAFIVRNENKIFYWLKSLLSDSLMCYDFYTLINFQLFSNHKCHIDAMALEVVDLCGQYRKRLLYKDPQKFGLA